MNIEPGDKVILRKPTDREATAADWCSHTDDDKLFGQTATFMRIDGPNKAQIELPKKIIDFWPLAALIPVRKTEFPNMSGEFI